MTLLYSIHTYMATAFRPRTLVLFAGDLLSFILALWLSLYLRAFEAPPQWLFVAHIEPFSLLFVAWVAVFFIAGLYENRSVILARRALSTTLLIAQTFNIAIAALFFFFVPIFGIAPKTLLFIYLGVSFVLTLLWRAVLSPRLWSPEPALAVGSDVSSYIAEGVRFFDATAVYEAMFGRIVLRRVDNRWVARHVSLYARV